MGSSAIAGGLISGVGGLIGSAMDNSAASARQADAYEQSLESWKYQQSNKHQLEIQDLKNAGLNPLLSATNGSSASGSGLAIGSPTGVNSQAISNAVNSALQYKVAQQNADNGSITAKATQKKVDSDIDLNKSTISLNASSSARQTAEATAIVQKTLQDIKESNARILREDKLAESTINLNSITGNARLTHAQASVIANEILQERNLHLNDLTDKQKEMLVQTIQIEGDKNLFLTDSSSGMKKFYGWSDSLLKGIGIGAGVYSASKKKGTRINVKNYNPNTYNTINK